jgi:hypothetical protein
MATYGQIRLVVEQRYPGVSSDLRDHYIKERYRTILDELDWRGIQKQAILSTTAEYAEGTVALTNGSTTVTGTDTTFTSAMTGREFRVSGRDEFYVFTYVSATSGTLSRGYEGDTDTETTYKIFQRVYSLASDIDILEGIKFLQPNGALEEISQARLDETAPTRILVGTPTRFALSDYDSDDRPTVELYPIPSEARGLPYRYTSRPTDLSAAADVIPEWMSVRCLTEGAMADLAPIAGNPAAAQMHAINYEDALARMRRKESRNRPGRQMAMASRFTQHRRMRGAG